MRFTRHSYALTRQQLRHANFASMHATANRRQPRKHTQTASRHQPRKHTGASHVSTHATTTSVNAVWYTRIPHSPDSFAGWHSSNYPIPSLALAVFAQNFWFCGGTIPERRRGSRLNTRQTRTGSYPWWTRLQYLLLCNLCWWHSPAPWAQQTPFMFNISSSTGGDRLHRRVGCSWILAWRIWSCKDKDLVDQQRYHAWSTYSDNGRTCSYNKRQTGSLWTVNIQTPGKQREELFLWTIYFVPWLIRSSTWQYTAHQKMNELNLCTNTWQNLHVKNDTKI